MKNIISTITILILILGIGFVIPEMIPAGAVAGTQSEKRNNSENEKDLTAAVMVEGSDSEEMKSDLEENTADPLENNQDEAENEGNLSIKTADADLEFSGKTSQNTDVSAALVDKSVTDVDNSEKSEESEAPKAAASTNDTKKTPEIKTEVVTAPAEIKPPVDEITYKDVSYTRWVNTPLNMRKGPGTGYELIASIPLEQSIAVTSIASNGWAKVTYNGKEGYVSGKYLSETEVKKPVAVKPPETAPVASAPVTAPAPAAPAPAAPKPQAPSYDAFKMYIGGKAISYKNGGTANGQRIIDGSSSLISTWGGAETFSGNDGYNTHFIGHNPGIFSVLPNLGNGNTIIVTDGNGQPTSYTVTRIFTVDDNGYNAKDGENYYNYMVSKRGGEVITLQTCLSSDKNLVIRAEKVN